MFNESLYNTLTINNNETIEIYYDNDAPNPLEDRDTLFTYYTWETRNISPQESPYKEVGHFIDSHLGDGTFENIEQKCYEKGLSSNKFIDIICDRMNRAGVYMLPITKDEHGIVYYHIGNNGNSWDSSVVGFAWAYKKDIYKKYNVKRLSKKLKGTIEKLAYSDLALYSDWANGDVYWFKHFNSSGEELESLGEIYSNGDIEYTILELLN